MKDLRDNESDDKRSMLLSLASKAESIAIWCVLGLSSTEKMESYVFRYGIIAILTHYGKWMAGFRFRAMGP